MHVITIRVRQGVSGGIKFLLERILITITLVQEFSKEKNNPLQLICTPAGPDLLPARKKASRLVVGDPTVKHPTIFSNPLPSSTTMTAFI
jgi:hypothetical protein